MPLPARRRPSALLASLALAALLAGGCSSANPRANAYVHTDPGLGMLTSADSLGSFVAGRVNMGEAIRTFVEAEYCTPFLI